jgi:hypothetical protein
MRTSEVQNEELHVIESSQKKLEVLSYLEIPYSYGTGRMPLALILSQTQAHGSLYSSF